jgi:hypothetical protein
MNEHIENILAGLDIDLYTDEGVLMTSVLVSPKDLRKFAEQVVRECKENFTKVWYEQGMDIRGAELGKFMTRFEEHFGVEE